MSSSLKYFFYSLEAIGIMKKVNNPSTRWKSLLRTLYMCFQHSVIILVLTTHFLSMILRSSRYLAEFLQILLEHILGVGIYMIAVYVTMNYREMNHILELLDCAIRSADKRIVQKWSRIGKMYLTLSFCLLLCSFVIYAMEALVAPLSAEEVDIRRFVYRTKHPVRRHPLVVYFVFLDETEGWNYVFIFILEVYYLFLMICVATVEITFIPILTLEMKGLYEDLCQQIMMLGDLHGSGSKDESLQPKMIPKKCSQDEIRWRESVKAKRETLEMEQFKRIVKLHQSLLQLQDKVCVMSRYLRKRRNSIWVLGV